jgi:hypothetical protein
MRTILPLILFAFPSAAQVCGNFDLSGAYGFQLSGTTTIAGDPKPMAAIGRLDFATEGRISGTSSVNFGGLFLGNPVTGTYSASSNCSFTFELQDDSGGWQHFRGTLTPGGARATFHQTDPATGGRGVLAKLPASCGAAVIHGAYAVILDGRRTATSADGAGNLSWKAGDSVNTGTYTVDSDCFVELNFGMRLRGIVVDAGRAVFAVQTDPGKVATATFTAQ